MTLIYPAIIAKGDKFYISHVIDLNIDTQGETLAEAIEMTRDAIGEWICYEQDSSRPIPPPSSINELKCDKDEIRTLIDINIDAYRKKVDNRTVRTNVSIPSYLKVAAEKENLNVSQVLQEALKEKLQVN